MMMKVQIEHIRRVLVCECVSEPLLCSYASYHDPLQGLMQDLQFTTPLFSIQNN